MRRAEVHGGMGTCRASSWARPRVAKRRTGERAARRIVRVDGNMSLGVVACRTGDVDRTVRERAGGVAPPVLGQSGGRLARGQTRENESAQKQQFTKAYTTVQSRPRDDYLRQPRSPT